MSDPTPDPLPPPTSMPVIPPQIPESPYAAPASEIPPAPNPAAGELATPVIRLVAVIIDGLILLPVHLILTKLFYPTPDIAAMQAAAMRGDYQAMASMASMTGPGFVTQLLVGLLTVAALVGINWKFLSQGQTIGKKLMKIQIRSRDGSSFRSRISSPNVSCLFTVPERFPRSARSL